MWADYYKVRIGSVSTEAGMVDRETDGRLSYLFWPERVAVDTPIQIGPTELYAGDCRACAGGFHVELKTAPTPPPPPEEQPAPAPKKAKRS